MTVIVDKLQKAEAERKAFETDLYKAQARLETKDDEITELKAKNVAVEVERKNFESQLYKAEAQSQSKDNLITELQSKANATESRIKALESELVETSKQAKEINELRAKNSELQREVEKKVTGSVLDADQRKLLAFLEANPATKTTVSNLVNQTIKTQNDLTGNGNTDNDIR